MNHRFFDTLEPRRLFAAGSLDSTFGIGGIATFQFSSPAGYAVQGAAQEADGKIVVGTSGGILRFNTNGSIDATFGFGGVIAPPSGSDFGPIGLQPGGKLVAIEYHRGVQGVSGPSIRLDRYDLNQNGTLDPTFNGSTVSARLALEPSALAIQTDGKILVGGNAGTQLGAVVRLLANGAPDTKFGNQGEVFGPGSASNAVNVNGIAERRDGTIELIGDVADPTPGVFSVTPFTEALSSRGRPTAVRSPKPRTSKFHPPTTNTLLQNITVRRDGMFVVGASSGATYSNGQQTAPAIPFLSYQGQASLAAVSVDALTATPGNQVVAGGATASGWTLERFLSNQQPDAAFGAGALDAIPLDESGGFVQLRTLLSTSDGRVVAVGSDSSHGVTLARVNGS